MVRWKWGWALGALVASSVAQMRKYDISIDGAIYNIFVDEAWSCDAKVAEFQRLMNTWPMVFGQGCSSNACSALVVVSLLIPECEPTAADALVEAQLERFASLPDGRAPTAEPRTLHYRKGDDLLEVAAAFLDDLGGPAIEGDGVATAGMPRAGPRPRKPSRSRDLGV